MSAERVNYVDVATGLCVIAFGTLLLLHTTGFMALAQILRLWPIVLVVVGAAIVLQARRGEDARRRVSVGGLIWLLLLGTMFSYAFDRRAKYPEGVRDGRISSFNVMHGDRDAPFSGEFKGAHLTSVMGGANIDLRQATIAPGEPVVIDVFTVMGGCVIRVPSDWIVDVQTTSIMGGVKDDRQRGAARASDGATDAPAPMGAPPRVIVTGTAIMGGVSIKS